MSLCNVPLQANEKEFNQQDNETDDLFLNFILLFLNTKLITNLPAYPCLSNLTTNYLNDKAYNKAFSICYV